MGGADSARLTPALREMLARIADGGERGVMLLQITANGPGESNKLQRLRNAGLVDYCDVPLPRGPVDGIRINAEGKLALAAAPEGRSHGRR